MSGYNTKQRRALLAFLGEHPDELLTARQMADALAEKQISLSAVYRNLAQLEAEEKVRRSAKSGSHEAFYQYLDAEGCKGALHMSCVKCGKTFHMADSNAALFAKHLAQSEQFTLDAADTILYGICSDCKGKLRTEGRTDHDKEALLYDASAGGRAGRCHAVLCNLSCGRSRS